MRSIQLISRSFIALLLFQASVLVFAQQTAPIRPTYLQNLETFLSSGEIDEDAMGSHAISEPEKWVLEAGEQAIPILKSGLLDTSNEQRRAASQYLLSLVGTPEARDLLKQEFDRTKESWTKTLAIFCMSSVGDQNDFDFMIDSLKGEHYGDEWPPIEEAALALGVLKVSEALPALKSCASEESGSIASAAAQQALKWISHERPGIPQIKDAPEREQLILTMFQSGIPRTDWRNVFYEKEYNQRWVFRNGTWTFQKVVSAAAVEDAPSIRFDVYVTENHSKALVAVGMTFGPLNGKGYNYLLKKVKGQWKVAAILSTWIS